MKKITYFLSEMLKVQNFVKCFRRPLNVRYAGTQATINWRTLVRQSLTKKIDLTPDECHELREKLLQRVPEGSWVNVDLRVLENCRSNELNIAKSYVNYLKNSGQELKVGTLTYFLNLYCRASKHGTVITAEDQHEIVEMCQHLLGKYPAVDAPLGTSIIKGLVLTADWRKSLEILDSIKSDSDPPMLAYSAIVQRAIQEHDDQLVWSLLNSMSTECKNIDSNVFTTYIGYCEKNERSFTESLNKILTYVRENQILVTRSVVNELQRVSQRLNNSCHITTISKDGKCPSCGKRLRHADITDEEFNNLRSHFLDRALIGTPQELESFNAFIDKTRPYDCVIDALNVTYGSGRQSLASVVKHFVDRKKTVLVIGREYIENSPKVQMDYIRANANLFLLGNVSQDDPYFLYSALKSGPNTDFVSSDLLRDHGSKMSHEMRTVFRRWQQQHQYMIKSINKSGEVTFEDRVDFDVNAQQVDEGGWHIPFEDSKYCTFQREYFELRKNWLCVSKN